MIPKDKLLHMYRNMLLIRFFEQKAIELFTKNMIRGALHVYIGQEAVAVGFCSALKEEDYITSTHRGHGHCIAKGAKVDLMMAELLGKATGYCKGKGGSMHIADFSIGILGANGTVGGGIPIAVGAALSAKMRKSGQVVVSFFGDGAINQGSFHEAVNLASIWRLPVIFVCENNLYAISTPVKYSTNLDNLSERARAYGIPGYSIDGNDVLAVYETAHEVIERVREGEGPVLIEAKTYRFKGHFIGDPEFYRTRGEVEEYRKRDPILRLKEYLLSTGMASDEELAGLMQNVKDEVSRAEAFAIESPNPDPEDVWQDLYSM